MILAYDGARAVGCAALRRLDDRRAEVKRVFVRPEYRGRGIARQMMGRLEDLARCQGYAELVLETGRRSPPPCSLPRAGVWGDAALRPLCRSAPVAVHAQGAGGQIAADRQRKRWRRCAPPSDFIPISSRWGTPHRLLFAWCLAAGQSTSMTSSAPVTKRDSPTPDTV